MFNIKSQINVKFFVLKFAPNFILITLEGQFIYLFIFLPNSLSQVLNLPVSSLDSFKNNVRLSYQ